MIYITGDTHGYCDEFMQRLAPCRLTGFLGHLYKELEFKRWFAGHWHVNRSFEDGRMNILWEDIVRLE